MTTYEHDAEGRLVRSETVWDPEWTDEDFAGLLEWQAEQADSCTGCGLPLSETTHPDAEDKWDAVGVRCHACKVKGVRSKRFAEKGGGAGMHWFPRRVG